MKMWKVLPIFVAAMLLFGATIASGLNAKVAKTSIFSSGDKHILKSDHFKKINPFDEDNSTDDDHNGDNGDHNGDEGDHNGGEDHEEHDDEGDSVHWNESSEEGKFVVSSKDNIVKFYKDKPKVEYIYYQFVNGSKVAEVKLELRNNKLYEFLDANGNGVIDSGEILYKLEFDEHSWVFNYTIEYVDNTTNIKYIKLSYTYNKDGYNVIINFYVYNSSAYGIDSGADKIKMEMIINSWVWHAENSTIATLLKIEAEFEKKNYGGLLNATLGYDEYGVFIALNNQSLIEFSWNTTVVIDGTPTKIINSYWKHIENEYESEEGETEVELELKAVIVFPRFNESLYYDPVFGVEDDAQDVQTILGLVSQPGGYEGIGGIADLLNRNRLIIVGIVAGFIIALLALLVKNHIRREE